jgi:hypothetical protein
VKTNKIKDALRVILSTRGEHGAGLPVFFRGVPGIGKTSVITQVCHDLGLHLEVLVASLRAEPGEVAGIQIPLEGNGCRYEPPTWLTRLMEKEEGVLLLDDFSNAPPSIQNAFLRIIAERVVGDTPLPNGVRIVAAYNPPEMVAGAWELTNAVANRGLHIEWEFDSEAWYEWLTTTPADPVLAKYRALLAAFHRANPGKALRPPREGEAAWGGAWPSPRTWDMAARAVAECERTEASRAVRNALVAGAVGAGAGAEWVTYLDNLDLPSPEDLLLHGEEWLPDPHRLDLAHAVLGSCVAWAIDRGEDAVGSCWRLLARVVEQSGMEDVAVPAASSLVRGGHRPPEATAALRALAPLLSRAEVNRGK